jgi:raffinose/stachyose/melibiose transport system permease protein
MKKRFNFYPYIYILPGFIFLGIFIYSGIFYNGYISLFKWNGVSLDKDFIGFDNYIKLFSDARFYNSLTNTLYVALSSIVITLVMGYMIALMLTFVNTKLQYLFKTIFFLPFALAQVIIGYCFSLLVLEPNYGYVNGILKLIGVEPVNWTGNIRIVLISVIIAWIFYLMGMAMVIYYTSILSVPMEVIESARVDGAGFFQIAFRIIYPMLQSTHVTLIIISIVAATRLFDLVWVMTGGGPAGYSEITSIFIFNETMINYKQGYASAASSVILVFILTVTIIIMSLQNRQRAKRGW